MSGREATGNLQEIVEDMRAPRTCTRCGRCFTDVQNLALLRCKWHPGHVQLHVGDGETPVGAYTCCKRDASAREPGGLSGCVPCDHTSRPDKQNELPVTLSLRDAQILFPDPVFARLRALAVMQESAPVHGAVHGLVVFCGKGNQSLRIHRFHKHMQTLALSGTGIL